MFTLLSLMTPVCNHLVSFKRLFMPSKAIMRWSDVLYSKIHFCLSPVVCDIGENPPEDLKPAGLSPVRDVKHFLEPIRGRRSDVFGALIERIGKKLEGSLLFHAR